MRFRYRLTFLLIAVLAVVCIGARAQSASLFLNINNRAREMKTIAEYAKAEAIYKEGLTDKRIAESYKSIIVLNYVDLCLLRGDYSTAWRLLEEYRPLTTQQTNRWIVRQAAVMSFTGDYVKADSLFEKAENIVAGDSESMYELFAYKGAMYVDRKSYAEALEYFTTARKFCSDERETRQIDLETVIPLARSGRTDEALALADECLRWFSAKLGNNHHTVIVALRKKAEILMMTGDMKSAETVFRDFFKREKAFVIDNFRNKNEQWRLDFWKTNKEYISEIFALQNCCPDFLADVALFRREVALLGNADSYRMERLLSSGHDDVARGLKNTEIAVDFVLYPIYDGKSKDAQMAYAAIVIPPYASGKGVSFVPLWTEQELDDFKAGGYELKKTVCSQNKNGIDKLYDNKELSHLIWGKLNGYISKATDIYFAPDGLLQMLGIENLSGTERLGKLHRMSSLARLATGNAKHSVQKGSSLIVGALDYDAADNKKDGIANHDAAIFLRRELNAEDKIFGSLGGTAREIAAVDSTIGNADKRTTEYERDLKKHLSSGMFRNVHIATHGYSLKAGRTDVPYALSDSLTEDKSLLASGLAMTGANVSDKSAAADDNIISARELCDLNLKGVRLLVMSACQTAIGEVNDEGPAGLLRGMKKAGCNAVVASLWKVDDKATARFMTFFYERLKATDFRDLHSAISYARKKMKEYSIVQSVSKFDPQTKVNLPDVKVKVYPYKAPRFWAPFILVDE